MFANSVLPPYHQTRRATTFVFLSSFANKPITTIWSYTTEADITSCGPQLLSMNKNILTLGAFDRFLRYVFTFDQRTARSIFEQKQPLSSKVPLNLIFATASSYLETVNICSSSM